MKKLITIGLVLFGLNINAQTMEKEYVNHLLDSQKVEELKRIKPFEWRMFPKPESITKRGNKVIVVFDRREWERMQYIHRKRMQHHLPPPPPPFLRRF